MNQQSLTTSSTVTRTDNVIADRNDAVLDASTEPHDRDFLLLCQDSHIAEAIHALYYLPQNYKLMIMAGIRNGVHRDTSWMTGTSFKDRIKFGNTEITEQEVSPYSFADAIISDEAGAKAVASTDAPYVVVSSAASTGLAAHGANGFTVQSGNPEALASAILQIARKA